MARAYIRMQLFVTVFHVPPLSVFEITTHLESGVGPGGLITNSRPLSLGDPYPRPLFTLKVPDPVPIPAGVAENVVEMVGVDPCYRVVAQAFEQF